MSEMMTSGNWSGPWVELDDGKTDNGSFRVRDDGKCLDENCIKIETDKGLGKYIYRKANLDGAQSAVLTYSIYHELEKDDQVLVEISRA